MPRYITLRPDLYEHLHREALVHDRTIKAQALHWLVIGRAIETSSLCTDAELSSLLAPPVQALEDPRWRQRRRSLSRSWLVSRACRRGLHGQPTGALFLHAIHAG
ncbi:MAG: hypothetical protein GY883_13355 [Shimia sp.]|nr:hypothetical protein [Shimia sp.]